MALETLTAAEIDAIEDYRCAREWTYRELAVSISARTGARMPEPTLYKALTETDRPMRRTTLYRFRRYLELLAADARTAAKPRSAKRQKSAREAIGVGR